jgi:hypothetical protein
MSSHRITRTAGVALSIAALAAPSALASTPQTLASPDAQDAAAGRGTFSAPEVTVIKVPEVATDNGNAGGIQWTDAGIGAGGMLGIVVLAGGTAALVTHRPRRRAAAAQPTAR